MHKFQCFGITFFNVVLFLLSKGPQHLFVLTKLYSVGFLNKFPACILLNKMFDNKINSIYITFLLFEHIIVWFLYLDSFI